MKVAVMGCGHGELEKVYGAMARLEAMQGFTVDLLLICGDFQAARNEQDLLSMAVPPKYRRMCDFYRFYSGELRAPVLTLVIGGNHEASGYMDELRYGGWLAENIYYLGTAGCVNVGDVRIAGLSGIYKGHDYLKGRFEKVPYDNSTVRSTYHIRALDVNRLMNLTNVDVMLSHDWPQGIDQFGDGGWLRSRKPFLVADLESGALGSPPTRKVMDRVRPRYWFAAHLHVKFAALVQYEEGEETRFLALDKCLPNRDFLQVLDIGGATGPLKYDSQWLTILKKTKEFESTSAVTNYHMVPDNLEVSDEDLQNIIDQFDSDLTVPLNFEQTAPTYTPDGPSQNAQMYVNPQTTAFCEKLGLVEKSGSSGSLDVGSFLGEVSTPAKEKLPLLEQTSTGKTIKRRNASTYNTE